MQIPGYSRMDYEERLHLLGLPILTLRRLRGDMIQNLSRVYDKEVGPKLPKGTSATRGHSKKKIIKRGKRLNIRKYFFNIRVATTWNGLPELRNSHMPIIAKPLKMYSTSTGGIMQANTTTCITHRVISSNQSIHTFYVDLTGGVSLPMVLFEPRFLRQGCIFGKNSLAKGIFFFRSH